MKRVNFYKLIRILAFCIGLIFFIRTFSYHAQFISLDSPQTYREDNAVLYTQRILDHKSIYTYDTMPAYNNAYGALYSYVVAQIARFAGQSYILHRIVTAVFLAFAFIYLYRIGRRLGGDWLLVLLGIFLLYYDEVFSSTTLLARSDTFGMLLFFISVMLPWSDGFSYKSICASAVISVLSFYLKPYFALGTGFVGAYLLLTKRIKKMITYAALWFLLFVPTALLVNKIFDSYFYNTIFLLNKLLNYLWWYLLFQTKGYIQENPVLFGAGIIAVVATIIVVRNSYLTKKKLSVRWQGTAYFAFCLLLSWAIIIIRLGGNAGSYLTYYHQLVNPLTLLVIAGVFHGRKSILVILLFAVQITLLLFHVNFTIDTTSIMRNRVEWETYLSSYKTILPAPPFSLYIYKRGMQVYDAGQEEFFNQGIPDDKSDLAIKSRLLYERHITDMYEKIKNNQFDLIMYWIPYTNGVADLAYNENGPLRQYVKTHYRYIGTKPWVTAYQTTDMELWEPGN